MSDREEVRDEKLVRYIVNTERRIVWLADENGAVSSATSPISTAWKQPPGPGPSHRWLVSMLQGGHWAILLALVVVLFSRLWRALGTTFHGAVRSFAPAVAALASWRARAIRRKRAQTSHPRASKG